MPLQPAVPGHTTRRGSRGRTLTADRDQGTAHDRPAAIIIMVLVVMVAGTYRPERDGVAHYVRRLRSALEKRGVSSVVLTTKEAALASRDKGVRGVVDGWGLTDLPSLLRSIVGAVRETEASLIHIQHAAG